MKTNHSACTFGFLSLLTLISCSGSESDPFAPLHAGGGLLIEESAALLDSLRFERIVVEYRSDLGGSSQRKYKVEYRRDGSAALHGQINGWDWGDFVGKVSLRDYARICELSSVLAFEELEGTYKGAGFHGATCVIRVEDESGRVLQEVEEYGGIAPISFWAVRSAAEAVMNRIDWHREIVRGPAKEADDRGEAPAATADDVGE